MPQRSGALAQLIFVDLFGSVAWFPVWWYTTGLKKFIQFCWEGVQYRYKQYAFDVWIKNFFVPMYAQYDWTGRLISIMMRFFVIVGRAIALAVETVVWGFLVLCWAVIPLLALTLAIQNIMAGVFVGL